MNNSKIKHESLEIIIMSLLKNNGKMHGYAITKVVKEKNYEQMNITESTLYPILHKLENEGKLNAESVITEGRLRKYYKICSQQKKEIHKNANKLYEIISVVKQSLNYKLKNASYKSYL